MKKRRFLFVYIFVCAFFVLFAGRIFYLQIFCSEEARRSVETSLSLNRSVPAPRGIIYDRNKEILAGNRQGYFVMIIKGADEHLALTVKNLADYCGITYLELLYKMQEQDFSSYNPFVFSEDAPADLVTKIKEFPEKFPCAKITTRAIRSYPHPDVAVHLLGRCGVISPEEYKKNGSYKRDDYIGKQGAEKAFEELLRGVGGYEPTEKYADGKMRVFAENIPPIPGNNVILTIDLALQQQAERALEQTVKMCGGTGGAFVICDVNSGEVLSMASYPAYSLENFGENYTRLSRDKNKPFFNRSISGLYSPGSTFKPVTAIAAMEKGVLGPDEKITTKGEYKYYDHIFRCNIFRTTGKNHGTIDVSQALGVSCNWFFYEAGKRTGIDAIAKIARDFGLDKPTGIELESEEAIGMIATPDNRRQRNGYWYAGDTLQASIGQSDNRFTPVALANYASAIANGGTLYKMHILKGTESPDGKMSFVNPQVINKINMKKSTIDVIHQGMTEVVRRGTAAEVFEDFEIKIAGKTGSAQVSHSTNGLFVGYAPADKPEIAFCVVLEGAPSGNTAAAAAKKVLLYYFETERE